MLTLLAVLTSASAPAASAARYKSRAKCPSANGGALVADAQAEIYEAAGHGVNEGLELAFGCAYAQGRSYLVGFIPNCLGSATSECGGELEAETLAGSVVAYAESSHKANRGAYPVVVRDLRNGRMLHRTTGVGPTTDLVAKSDGAVAWIVASHTSSCCSGPPPEFEVRALDKTGSRQLASGTEIAPKSLALSGSTLYWTQGGKPMSATLN